VTGGGGFLGSHLVARLEADGHDVVVPRRAEYDLTHRDEAERLFRSFYRHLAEGRSVGGALVEARRDAIRSGLPAAAWAGLVVLGDGDVVPVRGGRRPLFVPVAALATVAVLAGGFLAWRSRRRPRSPGDPRSGTRREARHRAGSPSAR